MYEKLKALHAIYGITYEFKLYHLRYSIMVPYCFSGVGFRKFGFDVF